MKTTASTYPIEIGALGIDQLLLFNQSGEYTFDFITQDAPEEIRFANSSSITWKVDDSIIGTGESITYRPNGTGTIVICVEWTVPGVEGGPDRCYRFCKKNLFC